MFAKEFSIVLCVKELVLNTYKVIAKSYLPKFPLIYNANNSTNLQSSGLLFGR